MSKDLKIETLIIHNSNLYISTQEFLKGCIKCGISKPYSEFYKTASSCKDCHKQIASNQKKMYKNKNTNVLIDRTKNKTCSVCRLTYPYSHFETDTSSFKGIKGQCKYCITLKRHKTNASEYIQITNEQFHSILDMPCSWCGNFHPNIIRSVDRYNPKLGYLIDNVIPSCDACNKARANKTIQSWLEDRKARWEYGSEYKPYYIYLDENYELMNPPLLNIKEKIVPLEEKTGNSENDLQL